ncbi:MAG: hypothetical protein AAGC85_23735 [Bacteroidota bacterium]
MRECKWVDNCRSNEAMEALTGEKGITYICTFISCFFLMFLMLGLIMMFIMVMGTTDHFRKIIHNTQCRQACQKE